MGVTTKKPRAGGRWAGGVRTYANKRGVPSKARLMGDLMKLRIMVGRYAFSKAKDIEDLRWAARFADGLDRLIEDNTN